ncbi:MAG: 1-acyl-sn-glycerol-3-phosphate acyltransferase [Bacteroidetes bacterium]|jgi:glycerol-3-phosphate O-acyltransferase|nr:1-acyl-sn-glycerol-3-phosphate acyltransferase [Bacteroidota bacterium]MDF1866162.1 1-acyl-sn-glycerol-3-phosphate acyltransferase [Saprospiraceae bacterium]
MSEKSKVYPHLIPEINDWPINKLHEEREKLVDEIDEFTFNNLKEIHGDKISDIIAKTIYLERIRIKEEPWKVDPPNDRMLWKKLRKKLVVKGLNKERGDSEKANLEILQTIVNRYSEEIVGTFRKGIFLFARKFLRVFFSRLLNTAAGRNLNRIFGTKYDIAERLLVNGEIEMVRKLMKKGTVVIVPTHFSNLDSILIGYTMDRICGLPSFSYGAGLNLYNTGYTAFFMNRLGAYRIDRRKKNPIYLQTLYSFSSLAIQKGTNSLFFPGGTRSRTGKLETKLKLGMMSTVMDAQRINFLKGKDEKVFIVPLILGYHVVLEGKFLIEQHLKITGKEQYISQTKDQFHSFRKLMRFAWNFFSDPSEINLTFGKPMDIVGNFVNENGKSLDRFGNEVDVKEYFMANGEITKDLQRESEYLRILGDRIVDRFHKENIVLTSHLVAFAAFNILRNEFPKLDLYGLLRLPPDDYIFSKELLKEVIHQLKGALLDMSDQGKIKLSKQIHFELDEIIKDGISHLGVYHPEKPLLINKQGHLSSKDFKLLYFYHNRLENYGLDKMIDWTKLLSLKGQKTVEV